VGTYLFQRISSDDGKDSRFDKIRTSPSKFYVAFFAQAPWVSLCTLPVILVNAIPRSAFALSASTLPALASAPYLTDILGLALFLFGLTFEITADRQKSKWVADKKAKKHSEEFLTHGLWSKSRHPNYFGESTLWTGIAIAAAGVLARQPAQAALGLTGLGAAGKVLTTGLCAASPAFVTFLLLKVSGVPLSEEKYDKRYGEREEYRRWKRETPMFVPKF
jgi:steroid 5-alpha reductase family enzyme